MKKFKKMYSLVQYIEASNNAILEDLETSQNPSNVADGHYLVKRTDCLQWYCETYHASVAEARQVLDDATRAGYIEYRAFGVDIRYSLDVTSKGGFFLEKLWLWRVGMWNDIIKHYNPVLTVSLTLITATFLGNIVEIAKVVYHHWIK